MQTAMHCSSSSLDRVLILLMPNEPINLKICGPPRKTRQDQHATCAPLNMFKIHSIIISVMQHKQKEKVGNEASFASHRVHTQNFGCIIMHSTADISLPQTCSVAPLSGVRASYHTAYTQQHSLYYTEDTLAQRLTVSHRFSSFHRGPPLV